MQGFEALLAPGQKIAFKAFVLNAGVRNNFDVWELWQPWTIKPPKQVLPDTTEILPEEKIELIVAGGGWCLPLRAAVQMRGGIRRNPWCGSIQFVVVHGTLQVDPSRGGGRRVLYLGPDQRDTACVHVTCGEERVLGQLGRVVRKRRVLIDGGHEVLDLTHVEEEKDEDVDLVNKLKKTDRAERYSCLYEVYYTEKNDMWSVYGVVCEPGLTKRTRSGSADPYFRHVKIRDKSLLETSTSFTVALFGPGENMPDNRLLVGDIFRTHRMQGQKQMTQSVSGRVKWPVMRDGRLIRQAPMTYTVYSGEKVLPPTFEVMYHNCRQSTTDELDKHIITELRESVADILYQNLREFTKDFKDLPGWTLRFNILVRVLARERESNTKVHIWVWDSTKYRPNEMDFHVALPDPGPTVEISENLPTRIGPGTVTRITFEANLVGLQANVNVGAWIMICEIILRSGEQIILRSGEQLRSKCIKVSDATRLYGITNNARDGLLRKRHIHRPPGLPPSFNDEPAGGPSQPGRGPPPPPAGQQPPPGGLPPPSPPFPPPSGLPPIFSSNSGLPPGPPPGADGLSPLRSLSTIPAGPTLGPAVGHRRQNQGIPHFGQPRTPSPPPDVPIPQLVRYGDRLAPQNMFQADNLGAHEEKSALALLPSVPAISAPFVKKPVIRPNTAMAVLHEMIQETQQNISTLEAQVKERTRTRGTESITFSLYRVNTKFTKTHAGVFKMKYCIRCKKHLTSGYVRCIDCQGTTDDRIAIRTLLADSSGTIPVIFTALPGPMQQKLEKLVWTLVMRSEGFKISVVSEVAGASLQEIEPVRRMPADYGPQERLDHIVFVEADWLAKMLNKEK